MRGLRSVQRSEFATSIGLLSSQENQNLALDDFSQLSSRSRELGRLGQWFRENF